MTAEHCTVCDLGDSFIEQHHPVCRVDLAFEDCTIRVRSNSPGLIEAISGYYRQFISPLDVPAITVVAIEADPLELNLPFVPHQRSEPGKRIKEDYFDAPDGRIVRKRLTGLVLLFGGELNLAAGPCEANDNQVINFINNRYIEWCLARGGLLFHAAGVASGERGLALAGFSGTGKSTLALHLLSRGFTFVSNDRLVIDRTAEGLWMNGVPKLPRVNPGTIMNNPDLEVLLTPEERREFAGLSPDALWHLEQKFDVYIDQCFRHGLQRLTSPLTGLVILNWRRDGGSALARRVDLAERVDLTDAFIKSVGLFYQPAPDRPVPSTEPKDYLRLLGDCPVVEVSGGVDFDAAADACLAML
jgi:HprK-related kinase B